MGKTKCLMIQLFLQDDSSKDLLHSENILHVLNIHLKAVTMV